MGSYFHWDDAGKTRMTAYLNLVTVNNKRKHAKSCDFCEKKESHTMCCSAKNIVTCLWTFPLLSSEMRYYLQTFMLFKQLEPSIL